jgi:hypothetical protein
MTQLLDCMERTIGSKQGNQYATRIDHKQQNATDVQQLLVHSLEILGKPQQKALKVITRPIQQLLYLAALLPRPRPQ